VTEFNKREGSPFILVSAIAFLGMVNVVTFRNHYFGNECFPWDFWKLYYAIIPFWTTSVSQHVFPEWVPFEGMGYPFFLNLQSSFFYPPLWLFVLPGVYYSFHAAVIVQCLHVLWGACGAFFLLRVLTNDWRSALFGALAYHFFGGFYSNAQHMDIVRAYAWLPWLFWGATVKRELQVRNLLLPAIFYCVATASYPGNIISHGAFLGIYILYQFCQRSPHSNRKNLLIVIGLLVLGVVMSVVALGPAFLLRNQLTSAGAKATAGRWLFPNWLSMIAPWTADKATIPGYWGDPSMVSAFVGVPTLALIILMRRVTAKAFAVWWLILIVALMMAQGSVSMFYQIAVRIVPVLGFSRMAPSGYRGLMGLALIVLASGSLSAFLATTREAQRELIRKRFKYFCLVPAIVMSGVFAVLLPPQEFGWLLIIWGATVTALFVTWLNVRYSAWLLPVLYWLLTVVGGLHVISVSNWTWTAQGKDIDALYKRSIGFSTSTWPLPIAEKICGVSTRPARIDRKRADFSWAGYLDGTYQMDDYGNTVLNARAKLQTDPALAKYMLQPLTPLVFQNVQKLSIDMVRSRLEQRVTDVSERPNIVTPVKYSLNSIVYQVRLTADSLLVENEIWFPGWTGKLKRDAQRVENIPATNVEETLRAWHLPAGQYKLVTQFRTPYLRTCAVISLAGLAMYLGLIAMAYRRWRTQSEQRNSPLIMTPGTLD
jgi:hypothetical protein